MKDGTNTKDGFSKQTFYRKSFARAKGIINEVTDVADAVSSLSRSCSSAVSGNETVEQVRLRHTTLLWLLYTKHTSALAALPAYAHLPF